MRPAWLQHGRAGWTSCAVILLLVCPVAGRITLNAGLTGAAEGCATLQVVALGMIATVRCADWVRVLVLAVSLIALFGAFALGTARTVLLITGMPHAVAYAGLLALFLQTLSAGQEPIVTRAARRMRGTLSPEIERYTRLVTIAWCGFFAAQLVLSFCLLAAAPLPVWSFFVGVLNVPLVVIMLVAEYIVRRLRFRSIPHAGLWRSMCTVTAADRVG